MKITKLIHSFLVFFLLLLTIVVKGQHFESVTITGIDSGNNSQNALFIVSSPTIPTLAYMRVQKLTGTGTVSIFRNTINLDNFSYLHQSGFSAANRVSTMRITFLRSDKVTPIPANDFRLIIDDIDGPTNEEIYTTCGSSVRYTALGIPTHLTINTTPPNLGAAGTATEASGEVSRIMFEYNDVSSVDYTIYALNGFVKEFDLNYDDFTIAAPRYSVCTSDFDGDGVLDNLDLDDDNDGILDVAECGGNNPNGDHDGDGLPNYLDTTNNSGQNATYIANADGSTTNYTDVDNDGVPDVYDSSADSDSLPNQLDLDSDGDGCFDALEGDENVTLTQLLGTGAINTASNGGIGITVNVNNGVPNLVNSGGAADIGGDVGQGIGNSINASLKDPLCYNLTLTSDSGATATGTAGIAFTVPNVLTNDTLDGVAPIIGTNPGQVAISQSGVWPSGITLNTATGQVNVGASVPAGTYNVTYQVCVNGTSPALCNTTTVTIILKADSDGDLIADEIDFDDDNDGILDTVENNCPQVTLTNTNTNFSTLLSAGTVTVGTVNITATRTGTVNSFNGDAYIGAGAHINPGFSGTYTNAGGSSFNTPVTSASITLNFSQPISTFSTSFKAMQDEEQITFSQPASTVVNQMNSTYGVAPSIMSLATLVNGGLELRSNLSGIVNSNTSSSFGSNSVVTWYFPVPVSSLTINHTGVNRGTGVGLTNYNGAIIGGDFTFVQAVACTPLDTDADGIINSLDTDSDGDGCPDAIEGAGNITASQLTSGHINGAVNINGVPLAAGAGQALGQSQDASKNDCSDVDADGVTDWQDLDDDNDGILDTVENTCVNSQIEWTHNDASGQSDAAVYVPASASAYYASAANTTFGSGLDETTDNYPYTYFLRNATATNFADAKTGNDYVQVSYRPAQNMSLDAINIGFYTNALGDPDYLMGNFKIAIEYSTSAAFTSPTLLFQDIQVGNMVAPFGYLSINKPIAGMTLTTGNTYYFRFYLYDEQNTDPLNRVRFDDVFFPSKIISTCDLDNDGIYNQLDTDSDGDGCPDAIEGAGAITISQVSAGQITGGVDANGVPTAVSGGQAVGQSQDAAKNDCLDNDNDGYPDWQDLDDDNDGILDSIENACSGSASLNLTPYNGQGPAATIINSNNLNIGNAIVTAATTYFGTGTAVNTTISDTHFTGEPGLYFNHTGTANSFANRLQYELSFSQPISNFSAYVNDLDDRDNIVINAYDQNNNLITITPADFTLFASTTVTYDGANQFSSSLVNAPNNTRQGSILLNFNGKYVSRIQFGYFDLNGGGSLTMGTAMTGASCNLDFDGDGVPNYLDTDSDGDGCPDAIEGGDNITPAMLDGNNRINVAADGTTTPVVVDAQGVPVVTNTGSTYNVDGQAQGQTIGSSANAAVNTCFCYKPAQTTGTALDTNHGITALGRAGEDNSNWPMVRKGAWTVLEAKTKGFVVNRLTDAQVAAIPAADLREGMMVYNITQDCLQINVDGTATGWKCFNTQTCPN